jgi:CRP/FNR family cyclic AMP-dependent transcriptional regulator
MKKGGKSMERRAKKRKLLASDVALDLASVGLDRLVERRDMVLPLITRLSKRLRFSTNQVVYPTRKTRASLLFLKKGAVDFFLPHAPKHTFIKRAKPGSFFGDMSSWGESMRSAHALAVGPCEVLVFDQSAARSLLVELPELTLGLVDVLARSRIEWVGKCIEAEHEDVESKLARLLLATADRHGIISGLTEEDVAGKFGVYRETVSKVVRRMKRDGLIEWERGRVALLDREATRELVMLPD